MTVCYQIAFAPNAKTWQKQGLQILRIKWLMTATMTTGIASYINLSSRLSLNHLVTIG
jgi:hypothetical protein